MSISFSANPPILPLEVLYLVVEYLEEDSPSLRNCALTCHALLWCARECLFRDILLRGALLSQRFGRLVEDNPRIALLVQSLTIRDIWMPREELPWFRLLANLRSLTLHRSVFECLDTLFQILEGLPGLEYIALYYMAFGLSSDYPDFDRGGQLSNSQPFCPNLHSLVVKDEHGDADQDVLAQQFLDLGVSEHLKSLDISLGTTDQHLHWVPLIRAARGKLQHLGMSMSNERIPDTLRGSQQLDDPYTFVGDALAGCASLTSLWLRHRPARIPTEREPFQFLEALCGFFERPEAPLPALEQITLSMVDRRKQMVAAQPHHCTRLARSLLTRTRYPRFHSIVVDVQYQLYSPYERLWKVCFMRQADLMELYFRWRAAFASFVGQSGVSLDVTFT